MKQFAYQPITSPRTIRLMKTYPGDSGKAIRVTIFHACWDEISSKYTALSYTWSDSRWTHSIWCRNAQVRITANLHAALLALRKSHDFHIVWADAVCINQADHKKRETQICLMREI
ncbi:heterokaryon incompatibility protein-domain-containing protein [Podospora didyma]|uniref:Heterokaryon incompatibility protein-domain-containing protein n=1 Tax=Podospora didyma TaxID=330526 RepID=A0AAE0K1T1_9PEZI|nr:heterokaryon incompatibility protein-domain-containing protein [Podospora didyma]